MKYHTARILVALVFSLMALDSTQAQKEVIKLNNPSFEELPRTGLVGSSGPNGWRDCGFAGQSAPDIQPGGGFDVNKSPQHGKTYVGMVTRDDDTYESIGQKLEKPMSAGKCYKFSLYAARSETYNSMSITTKRQENFSNAVLIRVWGGNDHCDKAEKLGETPLVTNTQWKQFSFKLKPNKSYRYIVIEAYYKYPVIFPYNGNVLIDNLSDLEVVPCDENAVAATKEKNETKQNNNGNPQTTTSPTPPVVTQKAPDVFDPNKKATELKEGQTLRIDNIYFSTDSDELKSSSNKTLDVLYQYLVDNPTLKIEVGGHTNGLPPDDYCDRLSNNRARKVTEYLIGKGITPDRVEYKGYGKRQPIADNATDAGRRQNQRVEIKILKIN